MQNIVSQADKQYAEIKGAKGGIVTALKNGPICLFHLYVRLEDGGVVKQIVNVPNIKITLLPDIFRETLFEEKEIIIKRIQ